MSVEALGRRILRIWRALGLQRQRAGTNLTQAALSRAIVVGTAAIAAIACDGSALDPGASASATAMPVPAAATPPGWGAGSNRIEGDIVDFYSGAVAGATVWLVGTTLTESYLTWRRLPGAPFKSDGAGYFLVTNLPEASVYISASKPGFVHPCAVRVDSGSPRRVTVELLHESRLDSVVPARPQLGVEPALTGHVFELTPGGRSPVAGARLHVSVREDIWADDVVAVTISDRGGGFFLCNLPARANLWVSKPGYETLDQLPIDGGQSSPLEIQLQRR